MLFKQKGWITARKKHKCTYCNKSIHQGETYYKDRYLDEDDGEWVSYKLHALCKDPFYHDADKESENLENYYQHWEDWYDQIFV